MTFQTDSILGGYKAMRTLAGRSVVYTQGATSVTLRCVLGQTQFSAESGDGMVSITNVDDFIFIVSELASSGTPIVPRKGDTIVRDGVTYTVFTVGSDAQYRYSDQEKVLIRVHARKV